MTSPLETALAVVAAGAVAMVLVEAGVTAGEWVERWWNRRAG